MSIAKGYGEEEGPTRDNVAPISDHAGTFPDYASLHPGYNQIEKLAISSRA
ncbi:hypothetical protein IVA79_13460 [Bradyrhizobium sp. 138]|uniref:hypothetical protein n=1 Tax=Bradyrhizobium sp. 138 TaxID=2782615 RepID=UPI001FFB6E26|nr:hypothetical protein [Bradyrhizobium sp. 138]MCK1734946.1 hypothetical protein [Bradyrhizobium sp. 138]